MAIAAVFVGSALNLSAQSTRDLGIGKILVAKRDTRESTFAETVILIVRYSHGGTVGLMLNRPSKVPISRALEPLNGAGGRSDPVFAGGPVELANVLALLRSDIMPEGAEHVTGKVYLVPTSELLDKTLSKRPDPTDFRVYLGYAGWGPGQLENEISHGVWRVMNASADIVFDPEPETLWSRLIERSEQRIARVIQAPACAANPSITAMFAINSAGKPCRFAR